MKTTFTTFHKDSFEDLYRHLNADKGLMTILAEMQTDRGIPERKAFENADAIVRMVAEHENLEIMLSEDAAATLDAFLHESNKMSSYDRKVLLHQLYFGLKLYQDPELVDQLQEGVSMEKLFHDYYTRWGEDPSITAEMLEAEILTMISNYHISPQAMRSIARRLKRNANTLATSAALGEHGQRFKCITAMELYLRNRESMTMEEAVNEACTHIQIEAMADAASCGQITEDRATKILLAAALAFLLIGVTLAFSAPAAGAAMDKLVFESGKEAVTNIFSSDAYIVAADGVRSETNQAIVNAVFGTAPRADAVVQRVDHMYNLSNLFMGGFLLTGICFDKAAAWMGRLAAKHRFVHNDKEFMAAEAMNAMADRVETAAAAKTAAESDESTKVYTPAKAAQTQQTPVFG